MEQLLLTLAGWADATGLRLWAGATPWVYPAANVLHVLGLALLVGGIGIVDLRIIGLWRKLPLAELSRALTPIAIAGLILLITSGIILFAADGRALAVSGIFQVKLVLVLLALANAGLFRLRFSWNDYTVPSEVARASAALSLLLWFAIATLGRLIAYF